MAGFVISLRQLHQTQHSALILNLRNKPVPKEASSKVGGVISALKDAEFETCALNYQTSVCSLVTWQAYICGKGN